MKKALLFILLLTMGACGHVDVSLTDQTKIYTDAPVRKSSLQVSVNPRSKQYRPLTAYFHPFVIQQENSDYHHLADAFAQIFHNVWTQEKLFPVLEYQPGTPYQGLKAAMRKARYRGADLLILGTVPYFYAGHTIDDTAITIRMNVYSTESGQLIWSMMQSGRIEKTKPEDYFYVVHEERLNESPFNAIIREIAYDMALPLKSWLPAPDTKYKFVESEQEMVASLTSPPALTDAPQTTDDTMQDKGVIAQEQVEAQRPEIKGMNLNIQFDFDKMTIKEESYALLDTFGETMNTPELKGRRIIIAGHTDSKGTAAYNLTLSKNRAEAVKTYLVNKWGVAPDQVETVGYGKSQPLSQGTSPEEMEKNRRVEVRLID